MIWTGFLLTLLLSLAIADEEVKEKWKKDERNHAKLPPCGACSSLVKSFNAGLDRTSRGKFEGGDTAWEESRQGKGYATSEVRFVEIQEKLCTDVDRGESQCHDNHHQWEEAIEEWWNLGLDKPELRQWLCVDHLKVCCPDEHYGSDCKPCLNLGSNGKICSGNGKCKGAGTRKGNGACQCNAGYSGTLCNECSSGYYDSSSEKEDGSSDDLPNCVACHKSCLGKCTGSGPTKCLACKKGYQMSTEQGCQDIDECNKVEGQPACKKHQFCVNTEGSYRCPK